MASLGNPPGGNFSYFQVNSASRISHMSPFGLSISNHTKRKCPRRIFASMALSNSPVNYSPPSMSDSCRVNENLAKTKIDEWMEGSVTDIVQNLKQAPLLVHVYAEVDGQGNSKSEFKTEKAILENWPTVKTKWRNGEMRSPDGLIFVEELDEENGNDGQKLEDGSEVEERVTRAWGIVVQGKGVECGPACYLLKTSRVGAGCGLGLFCTHFCLTKVTDFREGALRQLQDCWLLE